jgi:hypothetical protein
MSEPDRLVIVHRLSQADAGLIQLRERGGDLNRLRDSAMLRAAALHSLLTCIHAAEDIIDKLPISRAAELEQLVQSRNEALRSDLADDPERIQQVAQAVGAAVEAVALDAVRYLDEPTMRAG